MRRRLSDPIFTLSSGSLLADEGDEAHGERITVLGRTDRGTFTQLWGHTPWRKERGLTCPGLPSWKSWPIREHRVVRAKGREACQEEVVLAKSVRPKCCALLQKSWPEQNREGGSVQWWNSSVRVLAHGSGPLQIWDKHSINCKDPVFLREPQLHVSERNKLDFPALVAWCSCEPPWITPPNPNRCPSNFSPSACWEVRVLHESLPLHSWK